MDIKAKIEELQKQKADLDTNIEKQREASAKLKQTIKKLEKTVKETEALLGSANLQCDHIPLNATLVEIQDPLR